jgi:hypothetical protein|tara:strand:+ start:5557 stop:6081 length:525 start_codon:yes stop_codon:yes gene_type:complete
MADEEEEKVEVSTGLDRLKTIKLFDGKSLDEIFSIVFNNSVEERDLALKTFNKYDSMITSAEDLYMSGQHPQGYLDSAHKATENIIKMITASHKLMGLEDNTNTDITLSDIQRVLDEQGVAPERFVRATEKPVSQKKLSASARALALPMPTKSKSKIPSVFDEQIMPKKKDPPE